MTPEQYISIRNRIDAQTEAIVTAVFMTAGRRYDYPEHQTQNIMSKYYEKVKVP